MKWFALGLIALGMGIAHVGSAPFVLLVPIAFFMMASDS